LTPLQQALYEHFLLSNATRRLLSGSKATGVLSAITCLKKLCNHPKLIYDTLHSKARVGFHTAQHKLACPLLMYKLAAYNISGLTGVFLVAGGFGCMPL
jgi:SNF2 family DNA or RNA helicase